jgi:hypothetical protein
MKVTNKKFDYKLYFYYDYHRLRASAMERRTFGYLIGSHVYTSFIYNFLIIVTIKHSILPTQQLFKKFLLGPTNNSTSLL